MQVIKYANHLKLNVNFYIYLFHSFHAVRAGDYNIFVIKNQRLTLFSCKFINLIHDDMVLR